MKKAPQTFWSSNLFETGIGQVAIVRYKGGGRVEIGMFLVDVFCLGIKNAYFTQCDESNPDEFFEEVFGEVNQVDEHSAAWGRKVVEGATGYALNLGFAPHRHYKQAARVMGGIDPKDCQEKFVSGQDGKPLFIAGPNEGPSRCSLIINVLTKKCGKDGFHFIVPAEGFDEEDFE